MPNPTESQVRRLDEMVKPKRGASAWAHYDACHAVALSLLAELDAARERVAELESHNKAAHQAWEFYQECKAGGEEAYSTGAMKDAHEWVFQVVETLASLYERAPKPTGAETPEVE